MRIFFSLSSSFLRLVAEGLDRFNRGVQLTRRHCFNDGVNDRDEIIYHTDDDGSLATLNLKQARAIADDNHSVAFSGGGTPTLDGLESADGAIAKRAVLVVAMVPQILLMG